MASPLTFRVVVDVDTSKVKPAVGDVEALKRTISGISTNAETASESMNQFGQSFTDFSKDVDNSGKNVLGLHDRFRKLYSVFRLFKKELFIGTLIATPLILLVKREIELEQQTGRLTTKLEALGQAGVVQGERLKQFAETLQLQTGAPAKDTLQSFDIIIQKTRSLANAEGIVSASRKISIATGEKQTAVTQAIVEAMDGNTASLEKLTLKTRRQILDLVQTNTLVSDLDRSFTDASNRGLSSFTGTIGVATQKLVALSAETIKISNILERFNLLLGTKTIGDIVFDTTKKKVDALNESFNNLFKESRPDLTSLDGIKNAVGLIDSKLKSIREDLKNPLISPQQTKLAFDLYSIISKQKKELNDLLMLEKDLPTAKREQIRLETDLLNLQRKQIILQNVRPGTTSEQNIQQEAEKQLRHRIQLEKETQIDLDVINQVREIRAQKIGNVEEAVAKAIANADLKKIQSRQTLNREDIKIHVDTLQRLTSLKKAELDLFDFEKEHRIGKFRGESTSELQRYDEESIKRREQLIKDLAQKEIETEIAAGTSTAESRLAIATREKQAIEQLHEEAITKQIADQDRLANLSASDRAKELKAEEERIKREEELRSNYRTPDRIARVAEFDRLAQRNKIDLTTNTEQKLKEAQDKGLLTNSQEKALKDFKALEALLAQEKLKVSIDFKSNREQIVSIGTEIANVFYNTLRKILPQRALVAQAESSAKTGPDLAGAETIK